MIGSAAGDAPADLFSAMSKNKPTRHNIPHNDGTCKSFLRVFVDGPERRGKSRLLEMEDLQGKEVNHETRVMEVGPGAEAQVDFGHGAWVAVDGKRKLGRAGDFSKFCEGFSRDRRVSV
jgi:hypothetical protein